MIVKFKTVDGLSYELDMVDRVLSHKGTLWPFSAIVMGIGRPAIITKKSGVRWRTGAVADMFVVYEKGELEQ